MNNRKQRTIFFLAILLVVGLLMLTLLLDQTGWSSGIKLLILVTTILVLLRFTPILYRKIYSSRLVDMWSWLKKRYPPIGLQKNFDTPPEIILLRPPSVIGSAPDCGEALGLGYLASILRSQGFNVLILDARLMALDAMQTVELLMEYQSPLLGINLNFGTLNQVTADILRGVRNRGYSGHITLGGLYASVAAEYLMDIMPEVDTIVRFEGEITYQELLSKITKPESWASIPGLVYRNGEGEPILNPLRSLITDLDELPHPSRDLLPLVVKYEGFAYVLSSRGCNGVCAYCIQQRTVSDPQGDRWRGRDPQDVVDEIAECVQNYGIRDISFVDDDLFGGPRSGETHAHRLAQELIDRDLDINILISVQPRDVEYVVFEHLKRAGLKSVILSVDNFSQPVLDRYRKLCSVDQNLHSIEVLTSLGIDAYLGIIMFDPWTSLSELADNFEVISEKAIPFLRAWQIVERLDAYHGGVLTDQMITQGILKPNESAATYEFLDHKTQSVFEALKKMISIVQPALSMLDNFRWGSTGINKGDEEVKHYCKEKLTNLFVNSNQEIGRLALEIVQQQQNNERPLKTEELVSPAILKQLKVFNANTVQIVQDLRIEALSAARNYIQS